MTPSLLTGAAFGLSMLLVAIRVPIAYALLIGAIWSPPAAGRWSTAWIWRRRSGR